MEMNQNPVYSMSTTETPTTDYEAIQTHHNILYGMNTEANHTHQYETVDTFIEMNQNPVYSATTATNVEVDYYENDGMGPKKWAATGIRLYSSVKLHQTTYSYYVHRHIIIPDTRMHMYVHVMYSYYDYRIAGIYFAEMPLERFSRI